jgi:hypothetical protein
VKISINNLRKLIRLVIQESGGGWASPPQPAGGTPFNTDINNREQLGNLKSGTPIEDELSPHLRDADEQPDFDDEYGPVPPVQGDPYVSQDPFVRSYSPLPTPGIKR